MATLSDPTVKSRCVDCTDVEAMLDIDYGDHVMQVDLLPVGAQRRNWLATLLSDGHVMVRHPDLHAVMEIADRFGTDLQIYAG